MTTNEVNLDQKNNQLQTTDQTALQTTSDLPKLNIQGLVQFREDLGWIINNLMKLDVHYSKIKDNYFMLKPGLDLLCSTASLLDLYDEPEIIDEGKAHRTYKYKCQLLRMRDRFVVAVGEGEASTLETKFRYQNTYQDNRWTGKEELPEEKIYDKHYMVIQIAKTRAKRNAVNAFFSPAGFFADEPKPEPKPKQQPKPAAEKPKSKWNPSPYELNDPNWFVTMIKGLPSHKEIEAFHEQFELDEAFFGDADRTKIKEAYTNRWDELKVKK